MKISLTRFLLILALFASSKAKAQFIYNFSSYTQAYSTLTGGTDLNSGIWDTTIFSAPIPFTFHIGSYAINTFFLENSSYGIDFVTDTSGTINYADFTPCDAVLIDRGILPLGNTTSRSPVRYLVSGSSPSRIFKAEFANAGFADEIALDATTSDSVSLQIWLYEDSNIVEYHYGPSKISHPCAYFSGCDSPYIGFAYSLDANDDGEVYFLSGSSSSPVVDSALYIDSIQTQNYTIGPLIMGWPANGTVYRYTPKPSTASVSNVSMADHLLIYPTVCNNELNIKYTSTDPVSYCIVSINGGLTSISGSLQSGLNHIDVSNLPAGMYIVQCRNSNGVTVQKFVKM